MLSRGQLMVQKVLTNKQEVQMKICRNPRREVDGEKLNENQGKSF